MGDAEGQLAKVPTQTIRRLLVVLLVETFTGFVVLTRSGWVGSTTAWWATTLQAVGALVTFGGLLWAYQRARTGLGLWEMLDQGYLWVTRRWGRKRNQVIRPAPAELTFSMGRPEVTVEFVCLNRDMPVDGQMEQLADAIRRIQDRFGPVNAAIGELRRELEEVRVLAESSVHEAIQHIEDKIKKLNDHLARGQQLDLKWAIGGLLISTVGTVLQYWA